jgi:hypothetical protein
MKRDQIEKKKGIKMNKVDNKISKKDVIYTKKFNQRNF